MILPLISIVVSTYNGEKHLAAQLDSLIQQTYPNIEIIVADDNSTDQTKNILQQFSAQNIRVYYRNTNVGYSKNFFEAALYAKGEYIAFSDQDDIWLPGKLFSLYHAIENKYFVYSNSKLVEENGLYLNKNLSDIRQMQDVHSTVGFFLSNVVWGHTMMIKKELLQYFLPLPAQVEYDKWLAVQATLLTGIVYVPQPLTLYRQHAKTVTKTIAEKKTGSRKRTERFADYKKNLAWLYVLKNNPPEKEKDFYNKLYALFREKESGAFAWKLFFFLIQHQEKLFSFIKKNRLSRLIEIRKMARGERQE
jgi:glycosyltransferase involved in cell wall biosynthesis